MTSAEYEPDTLRPPTTRLPEPAPNWALFLDIDGTLIDLAPSVAEVIIPQGLRETLLTARDALGGALALVSGRRLSDIDALPFSAGFACAAEHGAILRLADGEAIAPSHDDTTLRAAREHAARVVRDWPGAVVERKRYGLTMHYRAVPQREAEMLALAETLLAMCGADFELLPAKMAFEIRRRGIDKGGALRAFMQRSPFAGRLPVFVGDDTTDEDGIAAARALGGIGLHVARDFDGNTAHVRDWIARCAPSTAEG